MGVLNFLRVTVCLTTLAFCSISCTGDSHEKSLPTESFVEDLTVTNHPQVERVQQPLEQLPPVPANSTVESESRLASDSSTLIQGKSRVNEAGFGNRMAGDSYVIAADESEKTAWAWYTLGDLAIDRPVSLATDVEAAAASVGGDLQPVDYYVGVANYCTYRWQWFGPFSESTELVLNGETMRERFVSGSNPPQMHVVILTSSDDGSALQINELDIARKPGELSSGYQPTRPIRMDTAIQTSAESKSVSEASYSQEHYVTLSWEFIPDPEVPENEATTVRAYRRLVGETSWLPIGDADSGPIGEQYIDFADNDQPFHGTAGRTYEYILRFFSTGGYNTGDILTAQIPLLPPSDITATPSGDPHQITLNWDKSVDATGYKIFRDSLDEPFAVLGNVDSYIDTNPGTIQHNYWIQSFNEWSESETGEAVLGYALEDLSTSVVQYNLMTGAVLTQATTSINNTHSLLINRGYEYLLSQSSDINPSSVEDWNTSLIHDNLEVENESLQSVSIAIDSNNLIHLSAVKYFQMEQEDPLPPLSKYHLVYGRSTSPTPSGPSDWTFHTIDSSDDTYSLATEKHAIYGTSIAIIAGYPHIAYSLKNNSQESAILRYASTSTNLPAEYTDWSVHDFTNEYKHIYNHILWGGRGYELQEVQGVPFFIVTTVTTQDVMKVTCFKANIPGPMDGGDWTVSSGPTISELSNINPVGSIEYNGDLICYGELKPEGKQMGMTYMISDGLDPSSPQDWTYYQINDTIYVNDSTEYPVYTLGWFSLGDYTVACVASIDEHENPIGTNSTKLYYTTIYEDENAEWKSTDVLFSSDSRFWGDFNGSVLMGDHALVIAYDDFVYESPSMVVNVCLVNLD